MDGPFALWRWQRLWNDSSLLAEGLLITLLVACLGLLLALTLGAVFGLFSSSRFKALRVLTRCYVEFFQNTPLVIQIFFLYNALPYIGIMMNVIHIGIVGIGVYHGAYVSEVVRAGISSIPRGQMDAARSQGFSYIQAMWYVILPQTIKIILPPMANQAVNLIKNTSVLALIAGGDLMYRADSWASNGTLSYGPAYVSTGLIYLFLCFPLVSWARRYEETLKARGGRIDNGRQKKRSRQ
jgi:putative glutamine transport system permease protein